MAMLKFKLFYYNKIMLSYLNVTDYRFPNVEFHETIYIINLPFTIVNIHLLYNNSFTKRLSCTLL